MARSVAVRVYDDVNKIENVSVREASSKLEDDVRRSLAEAVSFVEFDCIRISVGDGLNVLVGTISCVSVSMRDKVSDLGGDAVIIVDERERECSELIDRLGENERDGVFVSDGENVGRFERLAVRSGVPILLNVRERRFDSVLVFVVVGFPNDSVNVRL